MTRLITRRIVVSIIVLIVVSFITFVIQSFIPGDPARAILGTTGTPQQYTELVKTLHLNEPVAIQYLQYMSHLLRGDLGSSLFNNESVASQLLQRTPVTLSLLVPSTILLAAIGVVLGTLSVTAPRPIARIIDVFSLLGLAMPNFWLALLLVSGFAIAIPLFPAVGYTPLASDPVAWAIGLALPVVALTVAGVANVAKITRDGMLESLNSDYVRTLRASGFTSRSIVWKHGLRNSGISIITILGITFIGALSGSVYVEDVFALPGLGSLIVTATNQHDIPVIQGVALDFTLIVVVLNLITDVAYIMLNPKMRR